MSAADIQAAAFTDNDVAREAIEAFMWPNRPSARIAAAPGKLARSKAKPRVQASIMRP